MLLIPAQEAGFLMPAATNTKRYCVSLSSSRYALMRFSLNRAFWLRTASLSRLLASALNGKAVELMTANRWR